MVKVGDLGLTLLTGYVSFVVFPFLFFITLFFDIPYLIVLPIVYSLIWITYVVNSNKEYKLMKLQEIVIEIDEYRVTEIE